MYTSDKERLNMLGATQPRKEGDMMKVYKIMSGQRDQGGIHCFISSHSRT